VCVCVCVLGSVQQWAEGVVWGGVVQCRTTPPRSVQSGAGTTQVVWRTDTGSGTLRWAVADKDGQRHSHGQC